AIGKMQILPAVIIQINERGAEGNVGLLVSPVDAGALGGKLKDVLALRIDGVAVEGMVLVFVVRHEHGRPATTIQVTDGDPHTAVGCAHPVHGHAHPHAVFFPQNGSGLAVIDVKDVIHRIVGDGDV